MKELSKTIQELKLEEETIQKSQRETTLEIEDLRKKAGVHNTRQRRQNLR